MARDKLRLVNITFHAHHGVYPHERESGRRYCFDLELGLDLAPAGKSDDLTQTVNYSEVFQVVKKVVESGPYNLLETLAEKIASQIFQSFAMVTEVTVRARKPGVPSRGLVDYAEIEITRSRERP